MSHVTKRTTEIKTLWEQVITVINKNKGQFPKHVLPVCSSTVVQTVKKKSHKSKLDDQSTQVSIVIKNPTWLPLELCLQVLSAHRVGMKS